MSPTCFYVLKGLTPLQHDRIDAHPRWTQNHSSFRDKAADTSLFIAISRP